MGCTEFKKKKIKRRSKRKRNKKESDHLRKDVTVIHVYINKRLVLFKDIPKIFTGAFTKLSIFQRFSTEGVLKSPF